MAEAIGKPATRQPGDLGTGLSPPRRLEESALLRRYTATRSPEVRDEIVKRFMPLARSLALRYRGGSESVDDLVQVASLGLVKAVDRFEPDRGGPFTAFAVPTILGELRRHFRDHVWNLRLPRSLQEMALKVDSAVDELTEELKRTPTPTQIAAHIGVATEQVLESIAATQARRTLSLDAPAGATREPASGLDTIGSAEPGYDRVEADICSRAASLDDREWRVLRLRFVDHLTQQQIGRRLGVSQMQVSRINRRALWKLLAAVRGERVVGAPPRR